MMMTVTAKLRVRSTMGFTFSDWVEQGPDNMGQPISFDFGSTYFPTIYTSSNS
jgi:hypothetical protein